MATPNAAQPLVWGRGYVCPYHEELYEKSKYFGLTITMPGVMECQMCGRTFVQRRTSLSFDVLTKESVVP